ncbi:hypothetical protein [Calothrix sp. 336/3]|uniref:hypothetical protein n=1 Tax=Calothrix sp. 336/3 TaxID=1337936 RepID=UPI0004E2AE16|nr:hypothetical protein [Calothrix sp. 336/3]AKG21306.1 hypothetical protein IJ00_08320 [Calothrix sp. 336/3]
MTYATDAFQVSSSERHEPPRNLSDIKAVEISFEEHEIFAGDRAIAKIILTDEDFETQPWIVSVNGIEIYRANTWMKCFHFITWHFTQGTLPEQEEVTAAEKERVTIPVFTPLQKSKQFVNATNLVQKIYAKCLDVLQLSIQYLLLLLKTLEKESVRT